MTRLSVNINKLATLRNARGQNNPDLEYWTKKIQGFGAHGITIHPRPDERHVKKSDVSALKSLVTTEFNIEGYPGDDFLELISSSKPDQVTLVPDPPHVLTSNAGWNVKQNEQLLKECLKKIPKESRVSVFMEPETFDETDARWLKEHGVSRAELYTEEFSRSPEAHTIQGKYRAAADLLLDAGLELNAGHDLDQSNLETLIKLIPELKEVSIGHALICEALEFGMEKTIHAYLEILSQ